MSYTVQGGGSLHAGPVCSWPLVEDFPHANVFTVSHREGVKTLDMEAFEENLTADLMDGKIGRLSHFPVILVGHCVGGLIIKKICLAVREKLYSGNTSQNEKEKPSLGLFLTS